MTEKIRAKVLDIWNSGRVLQAWMGREGLFPLALVVSEPTSIQFTDNWETVESWTKALENECKCGAGSGYRIEYIELDHPRLGRQRAPRQVVFDEPADLIAYLGVQSQFKRFVVLSGEIRRRFPALKSWIETAPTQLLEEKWDWPQLLSLLDQCLSQPQPALCLLQMDHTDSDYRFTEAHRVILRELLERILRKE